MLDQNIVASVDPMAITPGQWDPSQTMAVITAMFAMAPEAMPVIVVDGTRYHIDTVRLTHEPHRSIPGDHNVIELVASADAA